MDEVKHQPTVFNEKHDSAITFVPSGHIYYVNGVKVPASISTIIATFFPPFPTHIFKPYELSEFAAAALTGTVTHECIECHITGKELSAEYQLGTQTPEELERRHTYHNGALILREKTRFYLNYSFRSILEKAYRLLAVYKLLEHSVINAMGLTIEACEYMVWGKLKNGNLVAGQIDAIFSFRDANNEKKYILVDWKTSKYIHQAERQWVVIKDPNSPFFGQKVAVILQKYLCQLHGYTQLMEHYYMKDCHNKDIYTACIVQITEGCMTIYIGEKTAKECPCSVMYKFVDTDEATQTHAHE